LDYSSGASRAAGSVGWTVPRWDIMGKLGSIEGGLSPWGQGDFSRGGGWYKSSTTGCWGQSAEINGASAENRGADRRKS